MRTAELVGPASRSPPVPHPSVHLSTRPSPIRLSVHTPTCYLPTHLSPTNAHTPTPSTSLPIHLSVHLCVHPSVYPPVHPLFLPSFHPPVLPMSVGPPQCIVGAQLSRGRCTRGCRGGCGRVVCSGPWGCPVLCGGSRWTQGGLPKDSGAPARPREDVATGWGPRERGVGQTRAPGCGGLGGAGPDSTDALLPGPGHCIATPAGGPWPGDLPPPGPPMAGSGGRGWP